MLRRFHWYAGALQNILWKDARGSGANKRALGCVYSHSTHERALSGGTEERHHEARAYSAIPLLSMVTLHEGLPEELPSLSTALTTSEPAMT